MKKDRAMERRESRMQRRADPDRVKKPVGRMYYKGKARTKEAETKGALSPGKCCSEAAGRIIKRMALSARRPRQREMPEETAWGSWNRREKTKL